MKSLFRFIAIIVLILFVILFPVSLLMKDIGAILFDPDTTKALIQDNFLNEASLSNIIQSSMKSLLSDPSNQSSPANILIEKGLSALDDQDWRDITMLIAPSSLLQQTSNSIVDALAEWINSDDELPRLTINMHLWKQNIIRNAKPIVVIILDALPPCTAEEVGYQIFESLNGEDGLSGAIPACQPPEPLYSLTLDKSNILASSMVQSMPDELELSQLNIPALDQLQSLKQALSQVKNILSWTWLIVLGFGILGVFMATNGMVGRLAWGGWSLFMAGFGTYLLSKGSGLFSSLVFSNVLDSFFSDLPSFLRTIMGTVLAGLGKSLAEPLALQVGLLMGFGFLAFMSAALLKRRKI